MKERLGTDGRILNTSPIVIERVKSGGRVIVAVIEGERSIPIAGVLVATRIAEECVRKPMARFALAVLLRSASVPMAMLLSCR